MNEQWAHTARGAGGVEKGAEMTIAQLKAWLVANRIPDDFDLFVVRFAQAGICHDEIEGIKLNSGGTSVQLEVYPGGWRPVSEGTTRLTPAGQPGGGKEARMTAKRYELIWRNRGLAAEPSIGVPRPGGVKTMKNMCCVLSLPYYKQGDDLAHLLHEGMSPTAAMQSQAAMLREAAALLEAVAERIKGHPVSIHADTHHIGLEGPEDILRTLVEEGVLDLDELEDFEEGEQ